MHSFRFPRVKNSLSLPYIQKHRRNHTPSLASQVLDIVPPVPAVEQNYSPTLATIDHGSRRLTPLPRFDPFSRPRADSLSSLVEEREADSRPSQRFATTTSPRLKQTATVHEIFSKINRQAASLGVTVRI
ncbi:hypothetical protein BDP27DRAFT_1313805 [Rhodocollybia butyracea]|uniref:Uncharacterized protein n=1 Tax=Rhodocollybia butyracea TaxID=206335 RepID=A0A9P5Q0H3_9AGAR|nr:hypothetical protein BDP27DRAFT_1313805 [Rhodocollybia butyracea]